MRCSCPWTWIRCRNIILGADMMLLLSFSRCFARDNFAKRLIWLYYLGACLVIFFVYVPILNAYFVGGDDFREIARAKFEDDRNAWLIFTTSHDGNRFRPLDRFATFITYQAGGLDPVYFRSRNIFFHLINSILFGVLISRMIGNDKYGPIMTLIFGLSPTNALAVSLAVTTKVIFGFVFLITSMIWNRIYYMTTFPWYYQIVLFVLSCSVVMLHEQGVLLALLPMVICAAKYFKDGARRKSWLFSGALLTILIIAVIALGRYVGGVINSTPSSKGVAAVARNLALAITSLFAPFDFLMVFGKDAVTRSGVRFISDPMGYLVQIIIYFGSLISVISLIIIVFVRVAQEKNRIYLRRVLLFACGLMATLFPVILYSDYSEIYDYVPSIFAIGLIAYSIKCLVVLLIPHFDRRIGVSLLFVAIISLGVFTLSRNLILASVAENTKDILMSVPKIITNPDSGAKLIFLNEPIRNDGYSLYGLEGVGSFEEFGIQPAVQLVYDRTDLSASLMKDGGVTAACSQSDAHELYILKWDDMTKKLSRVNCTFVEQ